MLQKLILESCPDNVTFHHNYSGRGMYGNQCIAISATRSALLDVIAFVICQLYTKFDDAQEEDFTKAVHELLDFKQDSMGFDVVIYWPHIEPLSEREDETIES
jgi:hypothetical protein